MSSRIFRRRWLIITLAVLGLAVFLIAINGCHGRIIHKEFVPNHRIAFDFSDPPCAPAGQGAQDATNVAIRYLGVSGLYIEWQGSAVLTAPFFTNYGLFDAAFGSVAWDQVAIDRGMQGLPPADIAAVLVGHSHYDHLGDLPPIIDGYAADSTVYLNRSGEAMLRNAQGIDNELVVLNELAGQWIHLSDKQGAPLPIRIMPIETEHADHLGCFHYAPGTVTEAWDRLQGRKLSHMVEGQPFAFLIDLLSPDGQTVAFRIHYQDSASSAPAGFPPDDVIAERTVDLSVLCIPSYWLVDNFPQGILAHTRARHALVTHYEDFFRSTELPLRFAPMLTDRRANRFMGLVRDELDGPVHDPRGPVSPVCGPSSPAWTMPLPGEWLNFSTD
jgi:hypothetical protein